MKRSKLIIGLLVCTVIGLASFQGKRPAPPIKFTKYSVITMREGVDINEFRDEVREALNEGWHLVGGVTGNPKDGYAQAVAK